MSNVGEDTARMKALIQSLGVRSPEEMQLAQEIADELGKLAHVHRWEAKEVIKYAAYRAEKFSDTFMQSIFSICDLKESDCMYGLSELVMRSDWLDYDRNTGMKFMLRPKRDEYAAWLAKESGQEPEPEKAEISKTVRELVDKIGDPNEKTFYQETLLCLQARAYRSAIVMGWNLAYGHLTQWVFTDPNRLKQFNDELTQNYVNRKRNIKYAEICEEEDFGNVKESKVIEVCRKSTLIVKEDYEMLEGALRKRNTYAHPNRSATANAPIASGHVAELVEFMLKIK